jgi:hypothetical protein
MGSRTELQTHVRLGGISQGHSTAGSDVAATSALRAPDVPAGVLALSSHGAVEHLWAPLASPAAIPIGVRGRINGEGTTVTPVVPAETNHRYEILFATAKR